MTEETSRMKQPAVILSYEEGPEILRDLGRNIAVATTGDYLGNLDLWVIILLATDYLTRMHLMNSSSHMDFSTDRSVYLNH